jgi:ADP-heptose:LPS heptosyltransferase
MKRLPHFIWQLLDPALREFKQKIYQNRLKNQKFAPAQRGNKVLVLAHSAGIGNVVEATPLVQAIRILWPTCHLTFYPSSNDLFSDWCIPDRIIAQPEEIKGERFDHVFVAYIHENIRFLDDLCTFDKIHLPEIWFNKWFLKNERDYYLDMLRKYGFKGETPPAFVTIRQPSKTPPETPLRFCIVPCGKQEAKWQYKKWPYYPELIQLLLERYPSAQICIIGTVSDEFPGQTTDSTQIIDLRGAYSLSETAWLIKHSTCVIGNDCGPMHIADAVQAAGVVLFGPTCVIKNGPRNKIKPLFSNLTCSPCHYSTDQFKNCQTGQCLKEITPEEVLKIIKNELP